MAGSHPCARGSGGFLGLPDQPQRHPPGQKPHDHLLQPPLEPHAAKGVQIAPHHRRIAVPGHHPRRIRVGEQGRATSADQLRGDIAMILGSGQPPPVFKRAAQLVTADAPDRRAHLAELPGEGRRALLRLVLDRKTRIGAMLNARKDPGLAPAAIAPRDDAAFPRDVLALADSYLRLRGPG